MTVASVMGGSKKAEPGEKSTNVCRLLAILHVPRITGEEASISLPCFKFVNFFPFTV